jgi:alkylation response protein AidB-like acyl-CoA dehydrogenase
VILATVAELARRIAARGDEIERARRLPQDLVDELTTAGCFRMLAPRSHGGAEGAVPTHIRMIEALAKADASVGWTVMIGCLAPVMFGKLPFETFDAIYADGPDVTVAGTYNPTGVATPTADGYRVSGRWSFASGCQHAHWLLAHSIVDDGRVPPMRMMVLSPTDVEINDTWTVSGLRGTGSHDFVAENVFVPADRSFSVFGEACLDIALLRIPELSYSSLEIAAVAVGIAGGALDDVTMLATGKVPAFGNETLAANPLFQHQLGTSDARLRAARTLLYHDAEDAWATAIAAVPFTVEHRARIRATTTWATQTAASVVDMAYTAGGSSSIYSTNPLQRRLRDIHALTQHFGVKPDTLTKAGAVLAGQEIDTTFL